MSLLNLNSPAGQSPRSKGSSRAWMGIGLVVAVLGIGSTFASSITLNSPGGTTEFGQGVTQTVYCGGDQSVTVTPTSTYTNASNSVKIKVITPKSSNSGITPSSGSKHTINAKDGSSFPKWLTRSSNISGWWLTSPTGSIVSSYPSSISSALTLANGSSSYYFAPEDGSTGKYKLGDSSSSWVEYTVQTSDETSGFKLGGVVISKIPSECSGVDFIVSGYGQTGGAQTLVANSGGSISITEVAALWTNSSSSVTPSRSRYSAVSTSGLVTASQTSSTLSFVFVPGSNGTVLSAQDIVKVVVETQEDVLGSSS